MTLKDISLRQLVSWTGSAAVLVIFLVTGSILSHELYRSAETALVEKGQSLGMTLADQAVDPMLLREDLAVFDLLRKAVAVNADVQYLCLSNHADALLTHTCGRNCASALLRAARQRSSIAAPVRFRGGEHRLLDIAVPVLDGELGYLHVGMRRNAAVRSIYLLIGRLGLGLVGGLAVVLIGSELIAAKVSQPLRALERAVSGLPNNPEAVLETPITGSREVVALRHGIADMVRRVSELECERQQTQHRMVHAERLAALGELAAGLAHEVHNPLDGMQECVRYLEMDPGKSPRAQKYYPMLIEGLARIARTMQHMLTFAHSGQNVHLAPCAVSQVIDSLALLVNAQLEERRVLLSLDNHRQCVCMCDRQALTQAGLNLVLNAADAASASADAEVRIATSCDAQWVTITIDDNGPGVPKEMKDRVFEPFFTTKAAGKGTGLGLSVSRETVRAAGGDLVLAPDPSPLGGARFCLKVPKCCVGKGDNCASKS